MEEKNKLNGPAREFQLLKFQDQDRAILKKYADTSMTPEQAEEAKEADRAFWTNKINGEISLHSGFGMLDANLISDGYHTFGELYEHRIVNYMKVAQLIAGMTRHDTHPIVWRSKVHSDGIEWKGWFILGIYKKKGKQITYHLPISKWDQCSFAETLNIAPEFDGHSSADALERLKSL